MKYECESLKRNSSVPPSLLLFSFFPFFGLNGSFYLSLICPLWDLLVCPLWDLLVCPLWDLFLTLRITLYILQGV